MKFSRSIVASLGLCAVFVITGCHRGQDGQAEAASSGHHGHGMDFSGMSFPMAKADFLAKINTRLRQRCASRDVQSQQQGRGVDCATLEAGIAKCATSGDVPDSITDQDDAHEASRDYFECVRGE
ncbi:hypothetical protein [Solilutibacter silvestris]|nr:hypothetical protein [Lysobacter silvestris]